MNSLFLRIYLSSLAFLAIAFFITLYLANIFIYSALLINTSERVYQIIAHSLSSKDEKNWQAEIKTYNALAENYTLSLITPHDLNKKEKQLLLQAKKNSLISDSILGHADLYALYTLPNSNWILKIDENNDSGDDLTNTADAVISTIIMILPLAFALFLLVRKLTKPIQHLSTIAKKLGQGDLSARADNNLLPPMNTLASGFNNMAEQLDETQKEQQLLIGAIPHELRTPLGRIRFALDLTRNDTTINELRKNIESIDGYVDEMQSTVDEILELNRLQNQSAFSFDSFELCQLIDPLLAQLKKEKPRLKLEIDCQIKHPISGNASLLKRAISNILNNAQRHAKTIIKVSAHQQNNRTFIRIEEDGIGIHEDRQTEVFIPFSTLDSSRNRNKSGIGLGLAIVKLIMKKHHGEVIASRSDLGGACFELYW